MSEIMGLRTTHSKTHDLGGGKRRIEASMIPMHYNSGGILLDIDMTVIDGAANGGIYRASLMDSKIGFRVFDRSSGKNIGVYLSKVGAVAPQYKTPIIRENRVSWPEVSPGVDIEFVFNNSKVNIFRKLNDASAERFAEWVIEEEIGEKTIRMNDRVFGIDSVGNETVNSVEVVQISQDQHLKSYAVRDMFTGRVFKRDKKTRVKTESSDVAYPVVIDPTITITITANADDGYGKTDQPLQIFSISQSNFRIQYRSQPPYRKETRGFFRFPGITLAQGSTIDSATLKIFLTNTSAPFGNLRARIQAKKLNDPAAPVNFAQAFNPGTLATNLLDKTITTAAGNYSSLNVKDIVQELVNAFDYSNEAMLFFVKSRLFDTSEYIDVRDSQEGSNPPQLVINYTESGGGAVAAPPPPIKKRMLRGVGL